jgi:hypothetical protein
MEKGFNSDIMIKGQSFHIQTEDWGPSKRFLVSQIFKEGAVFKSFKIPYEDVLKDGPRSDREAIKLALRQQHTRILDQLVSGQLK